MKTIADFKRKLVVGALVDTIHHKAFSHRDENGNIVYKDQPMGVRKLSIVQTNSFAFETIRTDGEKVDSWCDIPKKTEVEFLDNGLTIFEEDEILNKREPLLTYKFID